MTKGTAMISDGRDERLPDRAILPFDGAETPAGDEREPAPFAVYGRAPSRIDVALGVVRLWIALVWIAARLRGRRFVLWVQVTAPQVRQRTVRLLAAAGETARAGGRQAAIWARIIWVRLGMVSRWGIARVLLLAGVSAAGAQRAAVSVRRGTGRAGARLQQVDVRWPTVRRPTWNVRRRSPSPEARPAGQRPTAPPPPPPPSVRELALDAWRIEQERQAAERRSWEQHRTEREAAALRSLLAARLGLQERPTTGRLEVDGLTFAALWNGQAQAYDLVVLSTCPRCDAPVTSGDIADLVDLGRVIDDLSDGQHICDACRAATIPPGASAEERLYEALQALLLQEQEDGSPPPHQSALPAAPVFGANGGQAPTPAATSPAASTRATDSGPPVASQV